MTGKIKTFCSKKGTGIIETEEGGDAQFEIADVLAYDRTGLRPGKVVSFVVGMATPMRAYEIVVRTGIAEAPESAKAKETDDLRYTGFLNESGARVYTFEERVAGEETRQYRVVTEVALLLRHHVSLQETPSLCLRLLKSKLHEHSIPHTTKRFRCLLSEGDIRSFVPVREAPKPRFHRRPAATVRGPAPVFGAQNPSASPLPSVPPTLT